MRTFIRVVMADKDYDIIERHFVESNRNTDFIYHMLCRCTRHYIEFFCSSLHNACYNEDHKVYHKKLELYDKLMFPWFLRSVIAFPQF